MALSQEQKDFFFENGYLKHGPLLEPDEIELLRREYDAEFKRAYESGTYRKLSSGADNGNGSADAPPRVDQIMQMSERNIHFHRLLYRQQILDVVEDLMGPNIMLFHDQALYKPACAGDAVPWHQDNGYWRCTPANLISCWMTLDDVTADNGAMQVIPGSHLRPMHHESGSDTLLQTEVDASKAVVVELNAGECMFHHCQTLHYTQPNTTDRQRRAFAIHFMTPGTRGKEGDFLRVGFDRPMLRARI